MKFTIDRFEGDFVVVELQDGNFANVPKGAIPLEAKEGDILSINVEAEETKNKKASIECRISKLFVD